MILTTEALVTDIPERKTINYLLRTCPDGHVIFILTPLERGFFMPAKPLHIAIDGPIGSGKSTVAKEISRRLNIF